MDRMGMVEVLHTSKWLEWKAIPIVRMGQWGKPVIVTAFPVKNRSLLLRGREPQVRDLTLTTWLLRSQFQQVKEHWRQCYEYYRIHQPTPAQLDYDNRFKPTDIDNALKRVKFPPSTGSVLVVIQGIRDFEGQLVRAMKGLSQACVPPDSVQKPKGKGNSRSQSVPPP